MGNTAIHKFEKPKKNDLDIAYKIIEHTLAEIYELSTEGAKLKTARESKNKDQ